MAAQVGFAPTPSRLTGGWTTRYPTEQLALPAGVPPAFIRLEGGYLMYSATAALLKMVSAAGLAPAVPRSQAERVGSLHYALKSCPGVVEGEPGT